MEKEFDGDVLIYSEFVDKTRWGYWRKELVYWVISLLIISFAGFHLLNSLFSRAFLAATSELAVVSIGTVQKLVHGAIVGIAGWLVLRRHLNTAYRWIWVTSIGSGFAYLASYLSRWFVRSTVLVMSFAVTPDTILSGEFQPQYPGAFLALTLILDLIHGFSLAIVQSVELKTWFENARPWLVAALVQSLVSTISSVGMTFFRPGIFPLFGLSFVMSVLTAVVQGIALMYMLRREYLIKKDDRLEELQIPPIE
ncbi:MAG: hypothetical protein HYZ26_01080 [Chloroflexi bacterium]|nr:hypothetical protein [Chloroflexota bacterium]